MPASAPVSIQPISIQPISIQIDASLNCQLACPLCPTADGRVRPALGAGHLKLADFEALLDRNPQIAHVELSNYGEMFLNPQLADILACAFERKVTVSGNNGVNLNFAREDVLEAIVRYRVRGLTCSIDGATQETYSRYRVNGNLNRVLGHIDKIREHRAKLQSAFPLLYWQFVVFGHNEHELQAARSMATERGMEFIPKLSWDAGYSPVQNRDLVRIETGHGTASRAEYRERHGAEYTRNICFQLWHAPVLNWNGAMLGCCVNYWGDFGENVFDSGLSEAMESPKLEYARRMLTGDADPRDDIPCTTCGQYAEIRKSGRWLSGPEIQQHGGIRYTTGIVLHADASIRFAQVSIAEGSAGQPPWEPSGRLFRFGVDNAVYFAPPGPGMYTIFVRPLGSGGWMPAVSRPIEVATRPICQEFALDVLERSVPPENPDPPARPVECLPLWIR
jgi:hypothetical protein